MKKIMIIDDSPVTRNIFKTIFCQTYEIVEAENGTDALAKIKSENVDLFLSDLNMPDMSGIDIAKVIRKDPNNSKKPILIVSSEMRDEKKQEGKDAGVTGWISKDVDPNKLLEAINKLLG